MWDLSSKAGIPETVAPGSVDIAIMIFVLSALHPDEWAQAVKNAWTVRCLLPEAPRPIADIERDMQMLKPGGVLLFRDYGRNDMAQLRFKGNRFMQPGLYVRGDHTRVYFFERGELELVCGMPRYVLTTLSHILDELVSMFGGSKKPSTSSAEIPLDSLSLADAPISSPSSTTAPSTTTAPTIPDATTTGSTTPAFSTSAVAQEAIDLEFSPYRFELLRLGVDRRLLLNRKKQLKMYRVWQQVRQC